jgi:putative lipoprotein
MADLSSRNSRLAVVACALSASLFAASCMTGGMAGEFTLTGTATWRERMALPPGAVFEATLEDVSRANAGADVLGRARIESPGNPPIRFSIGYDPAGIDPSHSYAVRARVLVGEDLLFVTDQNYPALTRGHGSDVQLLLRRAGAKPAVSADAKPDASLEDTYWALVRIGSTEVAVADSRREPHFILHPDQNRVTGSGGCNRMTGNHEVAGDRITFSHMAGTMMACPDGMEHEKAFHEVLGKAARWRIEGARLQLLDAAGETLALFESRYME